MASREEEDEEDEDLDAPRWISYVEEGIEKVILLPTLREERAAQKDRDQKEENEKALKKDMRVLPCKHSMSMHRILEMFADYEQNKSLLPYCESYCALPFYQIPTQRLKKPDGFIVRVWHMPSRQVLNCYVEFEDDSWTLRELARSICAHRYVREGHGIDDIRLDAKTGQWLDDDLTLFLSLQELGIDEDNSEHIAFCFSSDICQV